jgi:tetratricopeptide (TPR) repeat protein
MPVPRAVSRLLVAVCLAIGLAAPAVAQTGGDPYFEFLLARRLESQGDQAGALAALQRAAALDTRSASIRAEIAAFQLRRNRREEAERAANDALALEAENVDAHRVLGLIFAARADATTRPQPADEAANVMQAITHLEKAAASPASASDINLFYTLGRLYMRSGNSASAVQMLGRVVGLNPGSVQARLTLAQAQLDAKDLNGAIQTLEEGAEDEPRVAATLGQYLEQAGRPEDAAKAYSSALAGAPTNRELKFRRLAALFSAGQYAEAAVLAAEAQTQHPDDLRFPRLRARALFQSGAPARAIEVLEPAAKANPNDAVTQFALAQMYNDTGRAMDAERTVRQVIAIEPANANALNYLGYMLAERGQQLDEAVRLVRRALDLDPNNPSYLDSLGWAYFRQGKMEDAERYLAPAAEKLPKNSVIQDHLGDVLAKRGRWVDAINAWTRALSGDGDDTERAVIEKKIRDARARTNR